MDTTWISISSVPSGASDRNIMYETQRLNVSAWISLKLNVDFSHVFSHHLSYTCTIPLMICCTGGRSHDIMQQTPTGKLQEKHVRMSLICMTAFQHTSLHGAQRWRSHGLARSQHSSQAACMYGTVHECKCACVCIISYVAASLTCSLMLLMPSGPSRLTACFTRSVRPQLSIRKPRSCRNFASVEAASSFLEAQKQSSVLKGKAWKVVHSTSWLFGAFCNAPHFP